jgi:hypothetical protein
MLSSPTFQWCTFESGYVTQEITEPNSSGSDVRGAYSGGNGLYLVPRDTADRQVATTPNSCPWLYLDFAQLRGVEQVEAFASKHGLLGRPITARIRTAGRWKSGESLNLWEREIASIRHAIVLWGSIRTNRFTGHPVPSFTREELDRELTNYRTQHIQPAFDRLAAQLADAPLGSAPTFGPEDVAELFFTANPHRPRQIPGKHSPRDNALFHLGWKLTVYAQALAPPVAQWLPVLGQFRWESSPRTLLGVMWAQFAESVVGGTEHRSCKYERCGRLFPVSLQTNRQSKLYCSPKCNLQDWRRRAREQRAAKPRAQRRTKVDRRIR